MKTHMAKHGRRCTVCASKHRHQIEVALAHGVSRRALARRFGLSDDAIGRHARDHVSAQVKAAILTASQPTAVDLDALKASESAGLLNQIVHQRARLAMCAGMCVDYGDPRAAISAEAAITSNLALEAKLLGQLVNVHDVRHTSVLISADYLRLRSTLIAALKPFPAAAVAVGAALHRLEAEAAADITERARAPRKADPLLIEHETSTIDHTAPVLPEPVVSLLARSSEPVVSGTVDRTAPEIIPPPPWPPAPPC
jgi:hypothetical protein